MTTKTKMEVLAIIPARAGSTRIRNKNTRNFCGKPLISYTIAQARQHSRINRVIVDTDSKSIATIAKKLGAEVPFLRPKHLATKNAGITDAVVLLLKRLREEGHYEPTHILLLQTTSPLRESDDIDACFSMMKKTRATSVLTVCETNPRFFHIDSRHNLVLVNRKPKGVFATNTQDWPKGYILNGCFVYLIQTATFLREKTFYPKNTKAVVCDKWRSVDLDEPEDFASAEVLYKNRSAIKRSIQRIQNS